MADTLTPTGRTPSERTPSASTGATPAPQPAVSLRGVEKSFTRKKVSTDVLAPLDLDVAEGEFVTLIGPSGCGKSTVLNMVAGLAERTAGTITVGGAPVTGPGADRGVVFQQHVLLPWMTARENVRFALDCAHPDLSADERAGRTEKALRDVHLGEAMDKRPGELSGGMQQRVGIARAFALRPSVLLLDEPFGALDALTRLSLQQQLVALWESDRRTVVMVTHDVEEAVLLSDRILVMSSGPRAVVTEELRVAFERPRDQAALRRDPAFHDLTAHLVSLLVARA